MYSPQSSTFTERLWGIHSWFRFSMLPIDLFFIGAAQQVIHADIVKVGQGAKHLWWQHPAATFVIGVGALRHIDGRTHLLLGQISIFPQVADPLVFYHYDHPRDSIGVNKLFYL